MSRETEEKMADTVKWYAEHKDDGRSIDKTVEFLKKTIDCMQEIMVRQQQDIQDLEGRPKENLGRSLWTPGVFRMTGDPRRLG
jgi:hypothetical protein